MIKPLRNEDFCGSETCLRISKPTKIVQFEPEEIQNYYSGFEEASKTLDIIYPEISAYFRSLPRMIGSRLYA